MEVTTTREEVIEALKAKIGKTTDETPRIGDLRPYAQSRKAVTVEVDQKTAEKLMEDSSIRIGLALCNIEQRAKITKCLRCWSPSHLVRDCNGEDRSNWCYNCGGQDHLAKECKSDPKCPDCKTEGHSAGTGRCPIYSKYLQKLRSEGKDNKEQIKKTNESHDKETNKLEPKRTDAKEVVTEKPLETEQMDTDTNKQQEQKDDFKIVAKGKKGKRKGRTAENIQETSPEVPRK
nr:serine/arginine-rich splicing factor RS2Z32-like [Onthophagus taurus]